MRGPEAKHIWRLAFPIQFPKINDLKIVFIWIDLLTVCEHEFQNWCSVKTIFIRNTLVGSLYIYTLYSIIHHWQHSPSAKGIKHIIIFAHHFQFVKYIYQNSYNDSSTLWADGWHTTMTSYRFSFPIQLMQPYTLDKHMERINVRQHGEMQFH